MRISLILRWMKGEPVHHNSISLRLCVDGRRALKVRQKQTVTDLCHSHLKVLLGDVNSPFSQSVHPRLCANPLKQTKEVHECSH